MPRKLTDADVAAIRDEAADGRSQREIAEQFGVSRRHVGRIVNDQARRQLGGLDEDMVRAGNVRAALDRFLDGLDLNMAAAEARAGRAARRGSGLSRVRE